MVFSCQIDKCCWRLLRVLQEEGPGPARDVEQFLRRGRPLAAFDAFLRGRAQADATSAGGKEEGSLLTPVTSAEQRQLVAIVMDLPPPQCLPLFLGLDFEFWFKVLGHLGFGF